MELSAIQPFDWAYFVYIWLLSVNIIIACISFAWYVYKNLDASWIYIFLLIERLGISYTISIALYCRWLKVSGDMAGYNEFIDNFIWATRCIPFAVGSSIYLGRLIYQFVRSYRNNFHRRATDK